MRTLVNNKINKILYLTECFSYNNVIVFLIMLKTLIHKKDTDQIQDDKKTSLVVPMVEKATYGLD